MAVICPNCNNSNNPLDEYCSSCGQRLIPEKERRCPQCGAQNPVSNVFCSDCGGRLEPAGPQPDSKEPVPDWLTDLRTNIHDEEQESSEMTQPESMGEDPSKDLMGKSIDDENMPDWLREIAEPPLTSDDTEELNRERPVTGEIPDWLRDVLKEQSALPPEEANQPSLTDVLLTLPESDLDFLESGELPEWLSSLSPKTEDEQPEKTLRSRMPQKPAEEKVDLSKEKEPDAPAPKQPSIDTSRTKKESGSLAQSDWLEEPFLWTQQVGEYGEEEDSTPIGLPEWLQELGLDVPDLAQPEPLMLEDEPKKEQPPEPPHTPHKRKKDKKQSKSLTDWLGATTGPMEGVDKPKTGATSELPGTGPLGPPELPDWLAAVSTPAKTAELPSWLTQDFTAPPTPPPAVIPEEEDEDEDEISGIPLPSWLTEEDAGLEVEKSGPASKRESTAAELPDWLEEAAQVSSEPAQATEEPPYWRIEPAESEAYISQEEAEIQPDAHGLFQAEIPDWLQALRPREPSHGVVKPKPTVSQEPAETSGPLEGLRGALVAADAAALPPKRIILPRFVITEQQQAYEKIAAEIVQPKAEEKPKIESRKRQYGWVERKLLPILIFIVVLVSAIPQLNFSLPFTTSEPQESAILNETYSLVDGLQDSALVIAAFDFSPALYGELEPLASVLIEHLMEKNARIITISTEPTGPQIAQSVMEKTATGLDYVYGQDYLNLGYIPGGAAGLQAFAASPWAVFPGLDYTQQNIASKTPATAELGQALAAVDLVLVITADQDDLVEWIEQVGQFTGFQAPIAAGSSASLEAWAQPYYYSEPKQLNGLISGIPGAAWYEKQMNPDLAGEAVNRGNDQTIGLIVIIILIIIGLLSSTVIGLVRGRHGNG
ncbi:MAG: zinc ribbon domain-containing protein [Anaerolineales bacterium]|nr:zinc ribbon domain-containing protein [Anaerolineales bacterium]